MKSVLTSALICATVCACGSKPVPVNELHSQSGWAVPAISAAHIRTEPRHSAEMSSQALMGTPLRITGVTDNGWYRIETPEKYSGYINGNTLCTMTDSAFDLWRCSSRVIVTASEEIKAYSDSTLSSIVSDLVPGCILQGLMADGNAFVHVTLPDGRTGVVETRHLTDLSAWAAHTPSADMILATAVNHTGTPYLWGGLSSKGMDCSGLTKMSYYRCGMILPRDASQQAVCGTPVPTDSLQKGDLLFFGNINTGRVNHVGIYDSDGLFIEASGMVKRSVLVDNDKFLYARRIIGSSDSSIYALRHPWYFIH